MDYSNRQLEILNWVRIVTQFPAGDAFAHRPQAFKEHFEQWRISYQELIRTKANYLKHLKAELMGSEFALDENNPETKRKMKRIKRVEVEVALLHGTQIMLQEIYHAFLQSNILSNEFACRQKLRIQAELKGLQEELDQAYDGQYILANLAEKLAEEKKQNFGCEKTHTIHSPQPIKSRK